MPVWFWSSSASRDRRTLSRFQGSKSPHCHAAMRHVKIIERLAGGPRYEDPNLAFGPRSRASRTLAGSTRQARRRSRCVIGSPWQPAGVPADLSGYRLYADRRHWPPIYGQSVREAPGHRVERNRDRSSAWRGWSEAVHEGVHEPAHAGRRDRRGRRRGSWRVLIGAGGEPSACCQRRACRVTDVFPAAGRHAVAGTRVPARAVGLRASVHAGGARWGAVRTRRQRQSFLHGQRGGQPGGGTC